MDNIDFNYIGRAISASILAGRAIMEVYQTEFDVEFKEDNSPLTIADKKSHNIISDFLKVTGIPVLSEEGKMEPFEVRKDWNQFWMVDPLDGTKEFIKRNGEFTVNIALMDKSRPLFGIIYVPFHRELYFGGQSSGSYKIDNISDVLDDYENYLSHAKKLPIILENEVYKMIGSRSHMSEETRIYFDKVKKDKGEISIISRGSSLKLCMIAEGRADEYPRFAPTMEWDIAAGQAIIEGAGKQVIHFKSGEIMRYNRENLLNGYFVAKSK